MEHYRRTAHTRFDIKFHLVWITKYRKYGIVDVYENKVAGIYLHHKA